MTIKIGPTFGAELIAAGLGAGLVWNADGIISGADLPGVAAVLAAHNAAKKLPREFTGTQFVAALVDLGIKTLFDQAAATTPKPVDGWYYRALTPNDFYIESNAKLNRICVRAIALGAALTPPVSFTLASIIDKAVTE